MQDRNPPRAIRCRERPGGLLKYYGPCRLSILALRFAKLVAEKEVRRFAETYVSTSVLASLFRLNSGSLARHLKESETPLLAIPIPDAGKGYAYFLRKDVAAQRWLPTRRMLREESQRRVKAARKQKWAEYGLAKEIASGKPMRRLLTTSRPAQRP